VDRGGEMEEGVVNHRLWEFREAGRVSGSKVLPSATDNEGKAEQSE
jgi:hypothetical protein